MLRIVSVLFLLLLACLSGQVRSSEWVYVVTDGDNLWNISKKYLYNVTYFEEVRKLNNINHPRRMQPGSLIRIPLDWVIKHSAKVSVKSLNGESIFVRNNTEFVVTSDIQFALGDELRVGNKASITLVFADDSEMTLSDGVIVAFDHLTQYGKTGMVDTRVRLSQGKMEIRAEKQKGVASRLDIATASAITSVRGTVFRVGVDKSKKKGAVVEVIEGEVAVSQDGDSVSVKQGFGLHVEQGKKLTSPIELLKAPELINFQKLLQSESNKVQWQPVTNAQNYKLAIADDSLFSNIIWQEHSNLTSIELPVLNDGLYYLRLTAITANGIEGVPNDNLIELNAFPKPPTIEPTATIHVNGSQRLSWSHNNAQHTSVLLQLSQSEDFSKPLLSTTLKSNQFRPSRELPTGRYYWRIATLEQESSLTHGPFSAINSFQYSLLLPAPSLKASIKNDDVFLSWKQQDSNQYIELQISEQQNFNGATSQTVRDQHQIELSLEQEQVTYIRARARLNGEPEPGEWSKPCKISARANLAICGV
ncbi:MAG: FecR domain-containing protein [Gammaproteobacteria bacterium]|nr:FecR domain-containing protein [Gammaproteobacteria bacterium]